MVSKNDIKFESNRSKALSLLLSNPLLLMQVLISRFNAKYRPLPENAARRNFNGVDFDFSFDTSLLNDMRYTTEALRLMYFGGYEPITIAVMKRYLKPGDTFIDVGANIGFLSAIGLGLVGQSGTVHAFEPVPQYLNNVKKLAERNPAFHIEVNQCAIGDEVNRAILTINTGNHGGNSLVPDSEGHEQIEVSVIRLDQYIAEKHLHNISLIKIDVEGYEFPVLKGLAHYFEHSKDRPAIITEIVPWKYNRTGYTLEDLRRYIAGFDYRAVRPENPNKAVDVTSLDALGNVLFVAN